MTPMQQRLYNLLVDCSKAGNPDVLIHVCYFTIYETTLDSNRDMQMKLGPWVSRINRHLVEKQQRIEPGKLKNTYRLNTDYRG